MENLKELTKAEEEIIQVLWNLEKAFVKDIIPHLSDIKSGGKPKYTTVATVLKVLEKKKFVAHQVVGNIHEFYPLVTKEAYSEFVAQKMVKNYFDGSLKSLVSFFVDKKKVDMEELDDIIKMIEKKKK